MEQTEKTDGGHRESPRFRDSRDAGPDTCLSRPLERVDEIGCRKVKVTIPVALGPSRVATARVFKLTCFEDQHKVDELNSPSRLASPIQVCLISLIQC